MVAVDDTMGKVLWTRHFLAAQGHQVPKTTNYQVNKSTILLAENEIPQVQRELTYKSTLILCSTQYKKK